MQKHALRHRGCARHALKLAPPPSFPKEVALPQNSQRRFFPALRYYAELHLPLLDKKQPIRRIPLSKYRVLLLKRHHLPALPNAGKEVVWIECESFLCRNHLPLPEDLFRVDRFFATLIMLDETNLILLTFAQIRHNSAAQNFPSRQRLTPSFVR